MLSNLVAIVGFAGSGKDTIGSYMISTYGYRKDSFAAPLKDAVAAIFSWDRDLLEGLTEESRKWREQVDEWWAKELSIPHLTPRWVLMNFGTETCRKHFHDSIWMSSFKRRFLHLNTKTVITDCRFPNELAMIKELGGQTIRVMRGPNPNWWNIAVEYNATGSMALYEQLKEMNVHPSEYAWNGKSFDFTVDNNNSFENLYSQIDSLNQ